MANVKEIDKWEPGIYQLETTDPVMGGEDGIDNLQAKQLANRTLYLKKQIETVSNSIPAVPVQSVNGKTGTVELSAADVDTLTEQQLLEQFLPAKLKSGNKPIYEVGDQVNFENRPTVNGNYIVTVDEFSNKLNTHGYQKLPSGLIIQWGGSGALGSRVCTYPISFNNFLCAFATSNDVGGSFVSTDTNKTQNPNAQIYLTPYTSSGAKITDRLIFINWLAIGY